MPRTFLLVGLFFLVVPVIAEPVPAWILRLPESTPTVFIAETSASAFHRFDRAGGGVVKVRQDYMSIGQGGTGKERSGDQRTPLGLYFVTEQLDTTRLHDKYGATAFPLDYPNAWDRRLGRTGDGIWVHGVDPKGGTRPPLDTDGCIALPNERLLALETAFSANVTPVLIGTELAWDEPGAVAALRIALEQAVLHWADSLEQGDMYAWLNYYDDTFRHWGMNKEEWSAFSLETVGRRPIEEVSVSDLLLLADPVENGLYLSRFRLEISEAESRKVISIRRMYWRRSESGALKIVAEDSG
jgi:murein L,D-transpeptidase YafK